MKRAPLRCRNVGARQRGLGDDRGDEGAEQMRGAFAQAAFGEIADDNRTLVHQAAEADSAARLRQHVAQARDHERLADLVLDRRNCLGAKVVAVAGIFVDPEGAHDGVANVPPTSRTRKLSSMSQRGSIKRVAPGTSSSARTALVKM